MTTKKKKHDTTPKYPWAKWLNGREHRLEPGKDFDVAVSVMQVSVLAAARRRSIPCKTSVWDGKLMIKADPW
jgi:hypothetical protein